MIYYHDRNENNRICNKTLDREWLSTRVFQPRSQGKDPGRLARISHIKGVRSRRCPITGILFELFVIGYPCDLYVNKPFPNYL